MRHLFLLVLALLFMSRDINAQSAPDSTDWEHTGNVSLGLNYISNNVFLGRKDTVVIPYFTPFITYTFRSGVYLRAEASYTTANDGRWDTEALEAGYNFREGKHWGGALYLGKYFYNRSSTATRSEILGAFSADAYYNNEFITPGLSVGLLFSQKVDVLINPSLSHVFDLCGDWIELCPTVALNAGTQRYYDAYFKKINKLATKKSEKVVLQADQFKITDYELSLDARGQIRNWEMAVMPVYAFPVNPLTISLPNRVVSENLSNTFFVSLTIIYHLRVGSKIN